MNQTFKKHYNRLNKQQKKAVDTIEGPVLVLAGPGSGKTEILSMRVANILRQTDAPASSILCLTFTEAAAVNMRQRLSELVGEVAYDVAIHTFHGFGSEVIQQYPEFFHEGARRDPADDLAKTEILQDIFANMSHDNPLSTVRPGGEFVYLSSVDNHITNLKKSGLNPEELQQVLEHNESFARDANSIFTELFSGRMSKSIRDEIPGYLEHIREIEMADLDVPQIEPLKDVLLLTLEEAYVDAVENETTKPVTNWRNNYLEKDGQGNYVIKSYTRKEKLYALVDVYRKYQNKLRERNLYDFDDMILDVVHTLEEEPELRANLKERYLYFLIDEFQDTNDAQMRLIDNIIDMEMSDGRPNIMAVGDDDQSIFKFQGANIDNILDFSKDYVEPEIITLQKSYRSAPEVLEQARDVILKGENRLENKLDDINKDLESAHPKREEGLIMAHEEKTQLHEFDWVAREIKSRIEEGENPSEIAVITRRHKTLQKIANILRSYSIPISYEKKENVFEKKHIQQIITILRFVDTLFRQDRSEAEEYLPEILSFDFWQLRRSDIWDISLQARDPKGDKSWKPWLEVMLDSDHEKIRNIANFLLELGAKANEITADKILSKIIGSETLEIDTKEGKTNFRSPFKEYYFSQDQFSNQKEEYVNLLSNLKEFIDGVKNFKQEKTLEVSDVIEYVDLHQKNKIELTDNSPYSTADDAVNLLSVHKAKGLEFNTVFVVSCQDKEWTGINWSSALPLPKNLPLEPSSDTIDDRLRLFYVAITRAKENVYMTYYKYKDNGAESPRLRFLNEDGEKSETGEGLEEEEIKRSKQELIEDIPKTKNVLEQEIGINKNFELESEEKALLSDVLENYKLSVTHFNNFLNVAEGGPKEFLEKNLLRFPQPKSKPAKFGSAMHGALQVFYSNFKQQGELPTQDNLLEYFKQELEKEELIKDDFKDLLEKGRDALSAFYKQKKDEFDSDHWIEFQFGNQGVVLDNAHLRGKIDKMEQREGSKIRVYDFKTGTPLDSWDPRGGYNKIKAWRYKNQLIFYKILVENSRKFGGEFKVQTGELEFLEPEDDEIKNLQLDIDKNDFQRVRDLAQVIYDKVQNLDFPDISSYSEDIKGIKEFEEDLLSD
ncbi:MAG: UvrD-helicase domain-containing protein [Candidatus Magasanikbacteria bacterium]